MEVAEREAAGDVLREGFASTVEVVADLAHEDGLEERAEVVGDANRDLQLAVDLHDDDAAAVRNRRQQSRGGALDRATSSPRSGK